MLDTQPPNRNRARAVLAAAAVAITCLGVVGYTSTRHDEQPVDTAHEGPAVAQEGEGGATNPEIEGDVPTTNVPTDDVDGGPKQEPGSNPSPQERIDVKGLPDGSKLIHTAPRTSLAGSKMLSTLYLLPGQTDAGRDLGLTITSFQNDNATTTFEELRSKGVDPAFGQRLDSLTVRGDKAAVTTSATEGEDEIVIVKWLERPDLQVELIGRNLTLEDALRYAEGVQIGK